MPRPAVSVRATRPAAGAAVFHGNCGTDGVSTAPWQRSPRTGPAACCRNRHHAAKHHRPAIPPSIPPAARGGWKACRGGLPGGAELAVDQGSESSRQRGDDQQRQGGAGCRIAQLARCQTPDHRHRQCQQQRRRCQRHAEGNLKHATPLRARVPVPRAWSCDSSRQYRHRHPPARSRPVRRDQQPQAVLVEIPEGEEEGQRHQFVPMVTAWPNPLAPARSIRAPGRRCRRQCMAGASVGGMAVRGACAGRAAPHRLRRVRASSARSCIRRSIAVLRT